MAAEFALTFCVFTWLCLSGNDSSVDGLVNFEKLRMIAKEIRHVVRLTSANMDPALMFRQRLVVFETKSPQNLRFSSFTLTWGHFQRSTSLKTSMWGFNIPKVSYSIIASNKGRKT